MSSSLDNMRRRLSYRGGKTQGRMNDGKLWSLKKALNSSYQAITLQTNDGRWFKALLNPSKVSEDYDTKILSIPYEDICLNRKRIGTTTEGLEKTDIAAGQTFRWVENGTDWLVTLHYYQETAYFRGIAQRCKYSVDVNGNKYPVVVVGPNQISEQWHRADLAYYNELNYTINVKIEKNKETDKFFHRFTKVKLDGKMWEVQAVDNMGGDGIISMTLKEDYENKLAKLENEPVPEIEEVFDNDVPVIAGPQIVYPYDIIKYKIEGLSGGTWAIDKEIAKVIEEDDNTYKIQITTSRSNEFNVYYKIKDREDIKLNVLIKSL